MTSDHFDATFHVRVPRDVVWERLFQRPDPSAGTLFLSGFESNATIVSADQGVGLEVVKDDEPCAGTTIAITLEDEGSGTRIRVVQSGFGNWLAQAGDLLAVGWRFIVADLQTTLATGARPRRHLRPWGDLGARPRACDGGVALADVHPDGPAGKLGMVDGDLLVVLAGAPVASVDDVVTILRVLDAMHPDGEPRLLDGAEWVRDGELVRAP
jgi:hypothetical protein